MKCVGYLNGICLATVWGGLLLAWSDKKFSLPVVSLGGTGATNRLPSNERYIERVLLQKTVSTGAGKIENDGHMNRYLHRYP